MIDILSAFVDVYGLCQELTGLTNWHPTYGMRMFLTVNSEFPPTSWSHSSVTKLEKSLLI